jgi:DNA processing protein
VRGAPLSEREAPADTPDTPEAVVINLTREPERLTDDEAAVLSALQGHARTADEIIEGSGLPARRILSALTMLQIGGLVTEEAGKRFATPVRLEGFPHNTEIAETSEKSLEDKISG